MKTLVIATLCTVFAFPSKAQILISPLIVPDDPVPGQPGETYASGRYALNGDQSLIIATTSAGTEGMWARTTLDSPFFPVVESGDVIDGVTIPDASDLDSACPIFPLLIWGRFHSDPINLSLTGKPLLHDQRKRRASVRNVL